MNSYNFEQLIRDELKKNSDQILDIDMTSITPMEIHMQELEKNLKAKKSTQRSRIKLRVIAVFSIILISLFMTFVWEFPTVKAFRFNVIRTFIEVKENMLSIKRSKEPSNNLVDSGMVKDMDDIIEQYFSFEEAKRKIPFDYIQAHYIPKGFIPKNVHWNQYLSGDQLVVQTYENDNGKGINIIQEFNSFLDFKETRNITKDADVKEMNIKGKNVLLIKMEDNFSNALWYDEIASYEIIGNLPEDEMIKIIENLN